MAYPAQGRGQLRPPPPGVGIVFEQIGNDRYYIYNKKNTRWPPPFVRQKIINEDSDHTFKHPGQNNKEIRKVVKNLIQFKAIYMNDVDGTHKKLKLKNDLRIDSKELKYYFDWCGIYDRIPEMRANQTYSFLAQIMSCKQNTTNLDDVLSHFYGVVYDRTELYYRQYSVRLNSTRSLRFFNDKYLVVNHNNTIRAYNQADFVADFPNYRQVMPFRVFVVGQTGYLIFCHIDPGLISPERTESDPILLTEYQYLLFPHNDNQDFNIVYKRVFNTHRTGVDELFLRETIIERTEGMAVSQAIIQRKTGADNNFVVTGTANAVLSMEYIRSMMHTPAHQGEKVYFPGDQPQPRFPDQVQPQAAPPQQLEQLHGQLPQDFQPPPGAPPEIDPPPPPHLGHH